MRPEWGEANTRALAGVSAGGLATWNAAVSSPRTVVMGSQAFMRPYWGSRGGGQTGLSAPPSEEAWDPYFSRHCSGLNFRSHSSGVIGGRGGGCTSGSIFFSRAASTISPRTATKAAPVFSVLACRAAAISSSIRGPRSRDPPQSRRRRSSSTRATTSFRCALSQDCVLLPLNPASFAAATGSRSRDSAWAKGSYRCFVSAGMVAPQETRIVRRYLQFVKYPDAAFQPACTNAAAPL